MKRFLFLFLFLHTAMQATEGAFPLYLNGYMGPKAGYMPPPGFYIRNDVYHHPGHVGANVLGGAVTAKVNAKISFDILTLTYISNLKLLGANVGCGFVLPAGRINVHGELNVPTLMVSSGVPTLSLNSKTIKKHEVAHGVSDSLVIPFMLGWHVEDYDLHFLVYQGVFLPTGSYKKGDIANMGQNHFATETDAGFTWLSTKTGTEISAITGLTVNFTNHKIHYRSGTGWHTDFYVGQYLTSNLEIGLSGYWFYQLNPDTGTGTKALGGFRSRVLGLGPSLSYEFSVYKVPVIANVRYFKEMHSRNYLKGDTFYLTFTIAIP